MKPWCESILSVKVEAVQGKQVPLEWTETSGGLWEWAIMKRCEGKVEWGEAMNEYARSWYSTVVRPGQSVYQGWVSSSGVGLFAGDTIERR